MSYRFKLNSAVPIYFKTNLWIVDGNNHINIGHKAKALIQLNPDGACYWDISTGQRRFKDSRNYKLISNSVELEINEFDALVASIVLANEEITDKGNVELGTSSTKDIPTMLLLEIKCYTDKRFKGKSKSLAEYILPEYANQEDGGKLDSNMDTILKTIQKTAVESETTLPQEYYVATGEAVASALSEQTLRVEIVHSEIEEEATDEITLPAEKVPYTAEDFNREITLPDNISLSDLEAILKIKHFLLFTAPPGTGKTTAAIALANTILSEKESDRLTLMSFNQATEYSDVVSGLRQNKNGIWKNVNGIIKNVCEQAEKDSEHKYIIVLDEINRGNTLAALGEYLTAMSKIGEKIVCNTGETITMPSNVYIIATMNTIDSSVTKLDAALRDRFAMVEMKAKEFTVESIRGNKEDAIELKKAIKLVIEYIKNVNDVLLRDMIRGNENQLGMRQLYTDYDTVNELTLVVKTCIKPQVDAMSINLDKSDTDKIDELTDELIKSLKLLEESKENEVNF